tara:strand:+ start:350 stop:628 length:279 start_codon:yes stop_codon:yes gene_type:complete
MNKLIPLILLTALVGCATNSGVVPIGNDQFFINKQAATGFSGLGNLKAEAINEGTVFCSAMKKEFELVSDNQSEGLQILGNYPWVEITFQCK